MRTASLVLGIVGGVLAIIFAIVFMVSGAFFFSVASGEAEGIAIEVNDVSIDVDEAAFGGADEASIVVGAASGFFWIIGILSIIGAVLGIVGGALAKKKNVVAGILMIVAAVPSFFTGIGFIASILFIIGGIFALVPESKPVQPTPVA